MFYVYIHPRRELMRIKLISDAYRADTYEQVMLLGVIGIYAENTFHFADRIQLISDRFAILTNNESCTFSKNPFAIYENHATYI